MARPRIGETAMTAAERMRRHRARKREKTTATGMTVKQAAVTMNISERMIYTARQYQRYKAFEWDADIFDRKYGRIGMAVIADICKHGDAVVQREIHDTIKNEGAATARKLWNLVKSMR